VMSFWTGAPEVPYLPADPDGNSGGVHVLRGESAVKRASDRSGQAPSKSHPPADPDGNSAASLIRREAVLRLASFRSPSWVGVRLTRPLCGKSWPR
jgi:hypothetical protein